MPGNFKETDLRVEKTLKALQKALLILLEYHSFKRITVNELCEKAHISRPTFYAHFKSKYNLLEYCLTDIREKSKVIIAKNKNYMQLEKTINQFVREYEKVIANLLKDATDETLELLNAFMFSFLEISTEKDADGNLNPRYIVFYNFCAGGMMKLLSWQIDNNFPQDLQCINTHFICLITHILLWETKEKYKEKGKTPYVKPNR